MIDIASFILREISVHLAEVNFLGEFSPANTGICDLSTVCILEKLEHGKSRIE